MLPLVRACALLAVTCLTASCAKKQDPTEAAKTFFALLGSGRSGEAYEATALAFKAQQSDKLFAQTTKELGLTNAAAMTVGAPAIEDETATLPVEIVNREGRKTTLTLTLVDERGAWRVFSVRAPRSTETGLAANLFGTVGKGRAFVDSVSYPKPNEQEVRKMVEEALLLFNQSILAGNFDGFYDQVAEAWQDQLTKGQLKRAFQGFITKQADIRGIEGQQAIFNEPPEISTEGLLTARGHYEVKPAWVVFATKFIYETPKWKLFGLDVSLAKPPTE